MDKDFYSEAKSSGNRQPTRWRPFGFSSLSFVCYWLSGCLAAADEKALAFDVDVAFYRVPQESPEITYKFSFAVGSDGKQWRLYYRDNPGRFAASGGDYIIEEPDLAGAEEWRIVSPQLNHNPVDLDQEQRLIWFVYGAKDYIRDREGLPVLVPFGDARLDGYVHGCRIQAKWRSSEDICPEGVEFLFDRGLYSLGVSQLSWSDDANYLEQRRKSFDQFLAGHTNGMVIGALLVSAYTNVVGLGIPVSWEFQLNWYGNLVYRCIGKVLAVREIGSIEPINLPPVVKITDKRIRSENVPVDSVTYYLTNAAQIPSVDDPVVQKQVQRLTPTDPREFSRMPRHIRRPRWPVVAALCILISLPIILWIRSSRVFVTKTKTKTK